ncbi:hypothetical protein [Mangrovactinospora gilvigrisea]|nr:hypothetical protein [Mangrovactinospora gilvigrisea]
MPGVGHGMASAGRRVDSYLSVLAGPAPAQDSQADATALMHELTRRRPAAEPAAATAASAASAATAPQTSARPTNPLRRKGLWLFAPLRKLRRNLFGGRA